MALRVGVVGAGLGGLATALALQQRGIAATVFEQAETLSEIGAGITLSPNATKVVNSLGLEDELAAVATRVGKQGVLHFSDGRILAENDRGDLPYRRYGAHYYQLHRADLHSIMAQALEARAPGAVLLGRRFLDFAEDTSGIEITFSDGSREAVDVLVGCDGIRSAVRDRLLGAEPPQFTGSVAWRGLVPAERVRDLALPLTSAMMIAPGRNIGLYPIRNETLINYVAICAQAEWTEEGWNIASSPEELLVHFVDWYPPVLELLRATAADECFKWGLFEHEPFERWSVGRVTLLGDAAHAMLPYMGQGAAMAMEDGIVLARCLASANDPIAALHVYEAARKPRTTLCQIESKAKGLRWSGEDTDAYDQRRHRNEESLGLFDYDATTVPLPPPP